METRGNLIDQDGKFSHVCYSLTVPDDVQSYWLNFHVREQDKVRGPYNNDGDKCWHFHGHIDSWKIWEC
jgi:hypothetical protein